MNESKNDRIAKTRQETVQRHGSMACKTYELKVDRSHLSTETVGTLDRLFLEAKWFYNHTLAVGIFEADYKATTVQVKDRFEDREIQRLSSRMRQEIIDRAKDSVRGLAALKSSGRRVGALKFVGRVNSIPLKQYGVTYRILAEGNRLRIQNVRRLITVRGVDQIPKEAEHASAVLIRRNGDYFVHVTTYQKKKTDPEPREEKAVGVDFGMKRQAVFSNGVAVGGTVPLTTRVRRLHRQMSRRFGGNWHKTNQRLNREYYRISNRRLDIGRDGRWSAISFRTTTVSPPSVTTSLAGKSCGGEG